MLLAVLMISSLLNVYYLLSIPIRAFFLVPSEPTQHLENRFYLVAPLVLTALISFLLFFLAGDLSSFLFDFAEVIDS